MAADEGVAQYALAQRYYIYSYRLAAEAGDPEASATALRGFAGNGLPRRASPGGVDPRRYSVVGMTAVAGTMS